MKKELFVLIFVFGFLNIVNAQKAERTYIFGHSLLNHEFQVNPTPSQETSVPHWMHFLAQEAQHTFSVSGQYGFLPGHANLPPFAQWGFDFVEGAWDSDNEPFSDADFNSILITPGNFIQWQGPTENYPSKDISPHSATRDIFEWCIEQEEPLRFYIYENWPDMGGYLANGFPPTELEWDAYNQYLQADFHDWFIEYHDGLKNHFSDVCIQMIPVGPIISKLLLLEPFNQIEIENLYEDDAPHGRASIYFLASMVTYMAMYEEKVPLVFMVDPIIDPIIADNYLSIVEFIWSELNAFNYENGTSRVFCSSPVSSSSITQDDKINIEIFPNPIEDDLYIAGLKVGQTIELFTVNGVRCLSNKVADIHQSISSTLLPLGILMAVITDEEGTIIYSQRLVNLK